MLGGVMIDRAYVYKDFSGIVTLSLAVFGIFTVRGLATYGQAVVLAYLGNRITAENQRLMFDKLLGEGVSYFADRHSTDFMARMSYAAAAPSNVVNLLITAFARDLLSVVFLVAVMFWEDPMLSLIAFVVAPPAIIVLRKLMRR